MLVSSSLARCARSVPQSSSERLTARSLVIDGPAEPAPSMEDRAGSVDGGGHTPFHATTHRFHASSLEINS